MHNLQAFLGGNLLASNQPSFKEMLPFLGAATVLIVLLVAYARIKNHYDKKAKSPIRVFHRDTHKAGLNKGEQRALEDFAKKERVKNILVLLDNGTKADKILGRALEAARKREDGGINQQLWIYRLKQMIEMVALHRAAITHSHKIPTQKEGHLFEGRKGYPTKVLRNEKKFLALSQPQLEGGKLKTWPPRTALTFTLKTESTESFPLKVWKIKKFGRTNAIIFRHRRAIKKSYRESYRTLELNKTCSYDTMTKVVKRVGWRRKKKYSLVLDHHSQRGKITELSVKGCVLSGPFPVDRGRIVRITIDMRRGVRIHLPGRVRKLKSSPSPIMSIRFFKIPKESLVELNKILYSL